MVGNYFGEFLMEVAYWLNSEMSETFPANQFHAIKNFFENK